MKRVDTRVGSKQVAMSKEAQLSRFWISLELFTKSRRQAPDL